MFAEESLTALVALNIIAEDNYKNKVQKLCEHLNIKLKAINEKHKNKIDEIKGTGTLNGIVFKSIYSNLAKLVEFFPLEIIISIRL